MVGFIFWEAPRICGKHPGGRQEGVEDESPIVQAREVEVPAR